MARNLLTALAIKSSDKDKLRDGDGLWLHRSKAGNRYWVYIFIRNGRRREMGLGAYGSGTGHVSITAARAKADEIRTILGRGGDPFTEMEERRSRPVVTMFGTVADDYIQTMKSRWKGAKTEASWKRFAETYVRGLRNIPVAEITTDDVLRVLKPIWHEMPETAFKTQQRIKLVLDNAKALGLRSGENPAQWKGHLDQTLPAHDAQARGHHESLPYSDLPALIQKLRSSKGIGARAMEFTIVTTKARVLESQTAWHSPKCCV